MRRSEPDGRSVDWRGWLILAWVLWFGLLYGKMIVERRGHRLRELVPIGRKAMGPRDARGPSIGIAPVDARRRR